MWMFADEKAEKLGRLAEQSSARKFVIRFDKQTSRMDDEILYAGPLRTLGEEFSEETVHSGCNATFSRAREYTSWSDLVGLPSES